MVTAVECGECGRAAPDPRRLCVMDAIKAGAERAGPFCQPCHEKLASRAMRIGLGSDKAPGVSAGSSGDVAQREDYQGLYDLALKRGEN